MGFGDDLMLTGQARWAQCQQSGARLRKLRPMLRGVPKWSVVYENNPRIARPDEVGDFEPLHGRDAMNNRPYHLAKSPERWTYNLNFRPHVGELYFSEAERAFGEAHAGRVVIEPTLKPGASPNKQWGRWDALIRLLRAAGLVPTQLGPPGMVPHRGVEFVATANFRMAAAVLSRARAAVLPEGGLHHAAAAVGLPAVVIFGGFTPVELTGYPLHRNLGVSLDAACGMRRPCLHCAAQMAAITPEVVLETLKEIL